MDWGRHFVVIGSGARADDVWAFGAGAVNRDGLTGFVGSFFVWYEWTKRRRDIVGRLCFHLSVCKMGMT